MQARHITHILAVTALTGSLFGIAWAQQAKTPAPSAPKDQPPAAKQAEKDEANEGGETAIKLQDAPTPVQNAIAEMIGGTSPKELSRETDDGITTYEVVWEVDGQTRSADLSANGDLLATETGIKADELPKTISDLIAKHHANAIVKQAELVQETYYEIVIMIDGKAHEVSINAAGEMRSGESKHDDDDDHDDDKGKADDKD